MGACGAAEPMNAAAKAAEPPGEAGSGGRAPCMEAGRRVKAPMEIPARSRPVKPAAGETGRGRRADVRSSGAVKRMETAAAAMAVESSSGKTWGSWRAGVERGRGANAPGVRTSGRPGGAQAKPAKA